MASYDVAGNKWPALNRGGVAQAVSPRVFGTRVGSGGGRAAQHIQQIQAANEAPAPPRKAAMADFFAAEVEAEAGAYTRSHIRSTRAYLGPFRST
jgi:hypothetical protein